MQWKHPLSPDRRKFKSTLSPGKVLLTFYWDTERGLLLEFLENEIINAAQYCATLSKEVILKKRSGLVWRSDVGNVQIFVELMGLNYGVISP